MRMVKMKTMYLKFILMQQNIIMVYIKKINTKILIIASC